MFGRMRVITAMPTNGSGPVLIEGPVLLTGPGPGSYVIDPDGNFVGTTNAFFIHRLLTARWVEDTRRLGG
jgi:hypothetical protein